MPVYLQIGPAVKSLYDPFPVLDTEHTIIGSSTEPQHIKWIPVASCEIVQPPKGANTGMAVTCTRVLDGSSISLFKLAHGDESRLLAANIDFLKDSDNGGTYLRVKMVDVVVSAYSISTGGATRSEAFRLDCDRGELQTITP